MNFRKCCLAQENECWFKTKPQKKKKKMYDSCSQNKTKQNKDGETRKEKSIGSVGENTDMCTLKGKKMTPHCSFVLQILIRKTV